MIKSCKLRSYFVKNKILITKDIFVLKIYDSPLFMPCKP